MSVLYIVLFVIHAFIPNYVYADTIISQEAEDSEVTVGFFSPTGDFTYIVQEDLATTTVLYLTTNLIDRGDMDSGSNDNIYLHLELQNGTEYVNCAIGFGGAGNPTIPALGYNSYICTGGVSLTAGQSVVVNWTGQGAHTGAVFSAIDSDEPYFILSSDVPAIATTTRFINLTLSTTTRSIVITGYIAAEDVASTTYNLQINTPFYTDWDHDSFVATTSGYFTRGFNYVGSFASTTIQQYTFEATLVKQIEFDPGCNPFLVAFCGTYATLDIISTTTFPGYVVLTPIDVSAGIEANCTLWSGWWSVELCIQYLLYPNQVQVNANIESLKNEFLTRAPIGYLTRFVALLSTPATSTMPSISYTFASTSPFGGIINSGDPIEFAPFAALAAPESPIYFKSDRDEPKTLWEIVGPITTQLVYLTLLLLIINDITGMYSVSEGQSDTTHTTKTSKGKTYISRTRSRSARTGFRL